MGLQDGANFRFWALLGHSWPSLWCLLDALGALLVASGFTWALSSLMLKGFGVLRAWFWRALVAVFGAVFECTAILAASNPAWNSHAIMPDQIKANDAKAQFLTYLHNL